MKINKLILVCFSLFLYGCDMHSSYINSLCKQDNINFVIKNKNLYTEIACSDEQRQVGLMNRKTIDKDSGMLFVFNKEEIQSFWMKDTLIPLSIAFINKNWIIVDIQDMYPLDLTPVLSKQNAIYAIEVNQNWFVKNNIKVGDTIMLKEELRP